MKARIEKKLSKKLVKIAPRFFGDAWLDQGVRSVLAEKQGTSISNVYHLGGGVDYWGEGQDDYTTWEWYKNNWYWFGDFKPYPAGHKCESYPNTETFRATTKNLLLLAAKLDRHVSTRHFQPSRKNQTIHI